MKSVNDKNKEQQFEARRKLDVCERNQDIYEPLW
jgi:hypothetical protein